ncbi:hypothetical protein UPYG_G00142150 [Umbra pygmaea]|uniref:Fibroin heavy chain-like n=1 Tax=Umbra pygmaea TaxID=75934 RepID=A0ABD0WZV4_UMBPY
MLGRLLFRTLLVLWLVHSVHLKNNGNGGVGRGLMPSSVYRNKGNGYGVASSVPNGNGQKSNGQGAAAGASNGHGARNPNAGMKGPVKGYGRPPFGAGADHGFWTPRGLGVPQLAGNERGGYRPNGAYARAGLGLSGRLGTPYSNGAGQKGPKSGYVSPAVMPNVQGAKTHGYGAGASVYNGQGAKPKGYGGVPNGYRLHQNGYGAGTGMPTGQGAKPNGYGPGAGIPKGYGAKPNGYIATAGVNGGASTKGYSGKPNGYAASAQNGAKPNGYGAGVGGYPDGGGAKASKPGYGFGAGGYNPVAVGYGNGIGAGYANGQGGYLGSAYGNGYSAPAKSGSGPYNGAPIIPAGLDGTSQFEAQHAGLGLGGSYGGQPISMGQEAKSKIKYGIGGLSFGGQPLGLGTDGAGKYGKGGSPYGPDIGKSAGYGAPFGGQPLGLGADPGKLAGKFGYGDVPFNSQPLGFGPHTGKSTGKYGQSGLSFEPQPLGLSPDAGKSVEKHGGRVPEPYASQPLGFGGGWQKSAGKYGKPGPYEPHTLQPVTAGKSAGQYENTQSFEPLSLDSVTAGKPYNIGNREVPPAQTVGLEVEGKSTGKYGNGGYLNGQAHAEVPLFVPVVSSLPTEAPSRTGLEAFSEPVGTAALSFASVPSSQTQPPLLEPDAALQPPSHQINIQQHLKLHIHPQGKSWRGDAKEKKYELTGFFGNDGHQG